MYILHRDFLRAVAPNEGFLELSRVCDAFEFPREATITICGQSLLGTESLSLEVLQFVGLRFNEDGTVGNPFGVEEAVLPHPDAPQQAAGHGYLGASIKQRHPTELFFAHESDHDLSGLQTTSMIASV
ncbi:hypothetical protein SELMODRAFT_442104 [Selaginella moellendorffii]|uniref:Uncharacterized protein n=1 Tax=Selaginella moellendorffii TaxID=88036 RepID=D8RQC1_SELML|nr:hypothetical protein SELMODRAFT_442104 [Selaginella moellendorffii]